MTAFQIFAILLTCAALGAYINSKFLKLPPTVGLMVVALLISLGSIGLGRAGLVDLEGMREAINRIDFSDIFMHGMLSFLLFAGALHIDFNELRKFRIVIMILATFGVLFATVITGTLVWILVQCLGFSFSYTYALMFGALIAPTDPVAVLGILKRVRVSKSLRIKIAGESLLNDGVGVVVFLGLLTAIGAGAPPPGGIPLLLVREVGGSVVLGLALGWITYRLLRGIDDYTVEVLLTLALVAGGYSLAEFMHISAPLTMVVAGLMIGNQGRHLAMSDKSRQHIDMFWELLDEVLNALLFIMMGLQMVVISIQTPQLVAGVGAFFAMLAGRLGSVGPLVSVLRLRYRFERGTIRLLTWGGLRGGISIALAMSLPPMPEKQLILAMTYVTVIFSVLFQGTTFRHVAASVAPPLPPPEKAA